MTTSGQQLSIKNYIDTQKKDSFIIAFCALFLMLFPITAPVYTTIMFYGVIVPLVLFSFIRQAKENKLMDSLLRSKLIILWTVYFVFLLFHTCINIALDIEISRTLKHLIFTYIFFVSSILFIIIIDKKTLLKFFYISCLVSGLCAIYSIINHFYIQDLSINNRLRPIGRGNHETLGALLYTIAAIFGLYSTRKQLAVTNIKRLTIYISITFIGAMVLLTQSRMPILIFFLYIPIIGLWTQPRNLIAPIILTIILIIITTLITKPEVIGLVSETIERFKNRGSGYRTEIWAVTINKILEQPIWGHGTSARIEHHESYSVHNLYLSHLFHTGIIGFFLFIFLMGTTLITTLKACIKKDHLSFLCLSLLYVSALSSTTEFSQPVKSPSPMWFIVWLPITWAIALPIRNTTHKLSSQKTTPSA